MRRFRKIITFIIGLSVLWLLFHIGNFSVVPDKIVTNKDNTTSDLEPVILEKVVDGDTIIVTSTSDTTPIRVRLIGIDCPESVNPDESKNTVEGQKASDFTKKILKDVTHLYLEYDKELYDKYQRTLAYVWLNEDTSNVENMLNYQILKNKHASPLRVYPNTKYAKLFDELF